MTDGSTDLHAALAESQRLGMLGSRPITEVVEHARSFVRALGDVDGAIIDLGAGGGVPGLVVAADRPDLVVTLLDRRMKRTDHLARLVLRLGWSDRISVVHADAERWWRELDDPFSAAIARGFGPPERTLRTAVRYVARGGLVVVSEPPSGDRWPPDLLADVGVERVSKIDGVACFHRP